MITKTDYKLLTRISIAASVITSIIIFLIIKPEERTALNLLGIVGFVLSILGIALAYIQILDLKESTKLINIEVEKALKRSSSYMMVADLSKHSLIIKEIQAMIRGDQIDSSVLKMADLKNLLLEIIHSPDYKDLIPKKRLNIGFENFNVDLSNLNRHLTKGTFKVDKVVVIENLESLASIFQEAEIKIKTNKL